MNSRAKGCQEHSQKGSGKSGEYARLGFGGKTISGQRAIVLRSGRAIPEGCQVDHLCGNARCLNPDHLEVVTAIENIRRSNATKLTVSNASFIQQIYSWHLSRRKAEGFTRVKTGWCSKLARQFGISPRHCRAIATKRYWK